MASALLIKLPLTQPMSLLSLPLPFSPQSHWEAVSEQLHSANLPAGVKPQQPSLFECRAVWKAFLHFLFVVQKIIDIWKLVFPCRCDLISFWLQNPRLFRALFLTQLATLHSISYRFIHGSDKSRVITESLLSQGQKCRYSAILPTLADSF